MKFSKLFFAAFTGAVFFGSCTSDDQANDPPIAYGDGFFVLNEGNMASGSVTFISNDLGLSRPDIFSSAANAGESTGGYLQSMFFDGDKAYIISNGSNKITVVNRITFEYLATIDTGLAAPRYGVALNGKAYVTNLNDFMSATDDYVAVIDLETLSVGAPIAVNDYADHILAHNGKLYVANGSFGAGNHITVIDAATNAVESTIAVGSSPNSIEIDGDILYVLCGTMSDDSKLYRIDTAQNLVLDSVTFAPTLDNAQNLDIENGKAYFTVGAKIYAVAADATAVDDVALVDTQSDSPYIGYGFAVHADKIFIAEAAGDFASDGKVLIYSTDGNFLTQMPVGLGPNGFFFND